MRPAVYLFFFAWRENRLGMEQSESPRRHLVIPYGSPDRSQKSFTLTFGILIPAGKIQMGSCSADIPLD